MNEAPQCQSGTPTADQQIDDRMPGSGATNGCACSPTTGVCAACRRTHRIAYGLVGAVAAITAGVWLVVWLLDR